MRVKLQNFTGEWVEFDIGDRSSVLCAFLAEVSGDEVLRIVRKDKKTTDTYDSDTNCRIIDYEDEWGEYVCVGGEWEDWFLKERVVNESEVNHE